jgi:hypothetical protein
MTSADSREDCASRMARHRHTVLSAVAYGALIAVAISLAVVAFWLFYPYKTVEVSQPYEITLPAADETGLHIVEQGGILSYRFTFEKFTDVPPTVRRYFIDGLVFDAGTVEPVPVEMGSGLRVSEVPIPKTLPPGDYFIEAEVVYQVNPIRSITHIFLTEPFTVVEAH